jgi:hypothetical protein
MPFLLESCQAFGAFGFSLTNPDFFNEIHFRSGLYGEWSSYRPRITTPIITGSQLLFVLWLFCWLAYFNNRFYAAGLVF